MVIPTHYMEAKQGAIASCVIICGDPLRAEYITKIFSNYACYNKVRGMLSFTVSYKNKTLSVQGYGMGMPSMGIYSYESYHYYNVKKIIRVGSAGALSADTHLMGTVLATGACTNSNFVAQYDSPGVNVPIVDIVLLRDAAKIAKTRGLELIMGNVLYINHVYSDYKFDFI